MSLARFWYRNSPQVFLGELLEKRWMEAFIPFLLMLAVVVSFAVALPRQVEWINLQYLARDFAPVALVAMAMAVTVLSGGIDLSVGAIFAMANFVAIFLCGVLEWSVPAAFAGTLAFGALVGAANGAMIAYVRTRPFLTTIVMLIILRALYDKLINQYTIELASVYIDDPLWTLMGRGKLLGLPFAVLLLIVFGTALHLYMTRVRPGVHIMAVGSSRKAARNAGIDVKRILFSAYLMSGIVSALAGTIYAARLNSVGTGVGQGWEVTALAAVVLGGISLNGGRGSIARAIMGAIAIFLMVNGLVQLGTHGSLTSAIVGIVLLAAMGLNVKWAKNKAKITQKVYVSPSLVEFTPAPSIAPDGGTPFAVNDRLETVETIGLNQIEGPEDVILDRQDRLYAVTRKGEIIRFSGEGFAHREQFARIGGRPLGMAFDKNENLICCVAGMGVYGVRPGGEVFKVTDQTNRSLLRLKDDSRLSLADDLDIAPDGRIFFSEATIRYDLQNWALDGFEGRGNGRLICYDPASGTTRTVIKDLAFPNGVCLAHDGQSILFCSTWLCKVYRYWLEGPKKGTYEVLIDNLPGYPDNINRASDGSYWLAFVGLRAPVYDLAMADPGFRIRMVKRIPRDEWLIPGLNYGAVIKFNDAGEVAESLWDPASEAHPTITSMREHKGWLYIGGLENNRIGRIRLPDADQQWTGWDSYWGRPSVAGKGV